MTRGRQIRRFLRRLSLGVNFRHDPGPLLFLHAQVGKLIRRLMRSYIRQVNKCSSHRRSDLCSRKRASRIAALLSTPASTRKMELRYAPAVLSRMRRKECSRRKREGFVQIFIYPRLGWFPWQCGSCRNVFIVPERGKSKRRLRTSERTESSASQTSSYDNESNPDF